jgi:hypothetical protein
MGEEEKEVRRAETLLLRVLKLEALQIPTSLSDWVEWLNIRISYLERRLGHKGDAHTDASRCFSDDKPLDSLTFRTSNLERQNNITYDYKHTIEREGSAYLCPACRDRYLRISDLERHFYKKHMLGQWLISSLNCHPCKFVFESPNALITHDKVNHKKYSSRMELYLPYFKQFPGKPD